MLARSIVALVLGWIGAVVLTEPARAAYPGSAGDLVWSSGFDIVVGDPFDSALEPRVIARGEQPSWSADGTQVAYINDPDNANFAVFAVSAAGAGQRQLTHPVHNSVWDGPNENDFQPQWSKSGDVIAFIRHRSRPIDDTTIVEDEEIRVVGVAGGGEATLAAWPGSASFNMSIPAMEWSPSGDKLAVILDGTEQGPQLAFVSAAGGGARVVRDDFNYWDISWSPDGSRLAATRGGSSGVDLFDADGRKTGSLDVSDGALLYEIEFLPDGGRLMVYACAQTCEWRVLRVPDEERVFDPREPDERTLPMTAFHQFDWQPADHPIIFIHGMLGSEMACGGDTLWPTFKVPGDLLDLRLDETGTTNAEGTCGAQPTKLLRKAGPADVYGAAMDALERLAPGRVHEFVWDWRRDPQEQMGALDAKIAEALADDLSTAQGLDQVVLVAHSFGGLFVRTALEGKRSEKVRRVLTLGTPYWGSPKAIFPLCCGVETPLGSALDNLMLLNSELREVSKNLTGAYMLFPGPHYGPWLGTDGTTWLDPAQVENYVHDELGGSRTAYLRGWNRHAEIDGFLDLEPRGLREYRAVVGTGRPTISQVRLFARGDRAKLRFASGDATVPAVSGTQGPIGTADPLGADVPISYVCDEDHVALPKAKQVLDAFGDYIRYGTPPKRTSGPCPMKGVEYELTPVEVRRAAMSFAARNGIDAAGPFPIDALRQAEISGQLDVTELTGETIAVADARRAAAVALPVSGVTLTVTPFDESGPAAESTYGPLTGVLTIGSTPAGQPVVTLDGKVPGESVPPTPIDTPGGTTTSGGTASPPVDRAALRVSIVAVPGQRLGHVLRHGLRVSATCSQPCNLRATLLIERKPALRYRLLRPRDRRSRVAVGSSSRHLDARSRTTVTVKLRGSARLKLRRARRLQLMLAVRAAGDAGQARRLSRTLNLRR